ncbi:hypothetical protein LOK49_LG08G01775 [Camellia lanceoleosa]|uniref:Uncharacterized protein n=1 Tax=Camellia lanceoleosa TaxID=1840588 RepID=A0ACC0GT68_9ERIC|nr:hypothetical protein LOK49_LG08G01775 [Camellia lanceoleosa]
MCQCVLRTGYAASVYTVFCECGMVLWSLQCSSNVEFGVVGVVDLFWMFNVAACCSVWGASILDLLSVLYAGGWLCAFVICRWMAVCLYQQCCCSTNVESGASVFDLCAFSIMCNSALGMPRGLMHDFCAAGRRLLWFSLVMFRLGCGVGCNLQHIL